MKKYFFLFFSLLIQSILAQSLVGINVDDLSDNEIISIFEKGKSQGFTIATGEKMALSMGLSPENARKFISRVTDINDSVNKELMDFDENEKDFTSNRVDTTFKKKFSYVDTTNIFGHDFFSPDLKQFDARSLAKAPDTYILGVGDELTLSVFGSSFFQKTYTVNKLGKINMGANFGIVSINGMNFFNVRKLLRSKISRSFDLSKNTFDLSLSYGRNISVNIVGEVRNPGTYSLSALNNAFHAILISGGPTEIGSLRKVQLFRNGKVKETVDLYKFFANPEKAKISFLQDGDFLLVPPLENIVSTSGAFRKNMYFELLSGESLADLLIYSSGFKRSAYNKTLKIFRSEDSEKIILDIPFEDFSKLLMKNGDSVVAGYKNLNINKFISLTGSFAQPGDYGFSPGMNLGEVIDLAGGIVGVYVEKELILSRINDKGSFEVQKILMTDKDFKKLLLKPFDRIHLSSRQYDLNEKFISVEGSVHSPGIIPFSEGMVLDDVLKIVGGLKFSSDNERIEITSQKANKNEMGYLKIDKTTAIVKVDEQYKKGWSNELEESQHKINAFDQIIFRDVKNFGDKKLVSVHGSIEFPGLYPKLNNNDNITDLIKRAGGLTADADPKNSILFRYDSENIVFDLESLMDDKKNSLFNYLIMDGDSIYIARKNQLITISGTGHSYFGSTGLNTLNVPYAKDDNKRANFYVKKYALGFSKKSIKSELYVKYPNSQVYRTKRFLFWNIYPKVFSGGEIVINKRAEQRKRSDLRKPVDWNQVVATLTSAAMGFGTVYALINRP